MSISIHRPNTKRHNKDSDFSFFLAGIVDGNGHFNAIPQLVICFAKKDAIVPYFIKKKIGFGIVKKEKDKAAILFILSKAKGLEKACNLLHNKLQDATKILQYNTRLKGFLQTKKVFFALSENPWFSGFFCSDGCFQIKILQIKGKPLPEVRLVIEINQKQETLLLQIKEAFGGSIHFHAPQNTYNYSSVSFLSARKIIQYFDKFSLMGAKQTQYVLWRKVYIKIQENAHLETDGISYIKNIKERMSALGK